MLIEAGLLEPTDADPARLLYRSPNSLHLVLPSVEVRDQRSSCLMFPE